MPATTTARRPAAAINANMDKLSERAARGVLPPVPRLAESYADRRAHLAELAEAAKRGDLRALRADTTEPRSTGRRILVNYRDLCIIALKAQRKAAKPAPAPGAE